MLTYLPKQVNKTHVEFFFFGPFLVFQYAVLYFIYVKLSIYAAKLEFKI